MGGQLQVFGMPAQALIDKVMSMPLAALPRHGDA
jgi:hypothetical protein